MLPALGQKIYEIIGALSKITDSVGGREGSWVCQNAAVPVVDLILGGSHF